MFSHKIQLKAASSSPKDPFIKTFDFKTINTPKGDILQVSIQKLSEKNRSWVKRFLQVSGLIFPETPKKKGDFPGDGIGQKTSGQRPENHASLERGGC